MWPFKRNNPSSDNVPPEVQEYYQSEQKQRVGFAWLLAVGTLLVTVVVALGLFFGGRWVYRKVDKKPGKTQTAQTAPTAQNPVPVGGAAVTPTLQGSVNAPATSSTSTQPAVTQNTQPTATPPQNDLPHTGPASNAAVVLGTALVSAAAYQIVLRRRVKA